MIIIKSIITAIHVLVLLSKYHNKKLQTALCLACKISHKHKDIYHDSFIVNIYI